MTAITPRDVVTIGRVGIDLYPSTANVSLDQVTTFQRSLGGSATNVAVAAARHGLSSSVITRTGQDPFGKFVRDELTRFGVSTDFVGEVPGLNTPIVFCEVFPPDDFPLYFYRDPVAPDLMINAEELDLDAIRDAGLFWATLTGLSRDPSRSAHFAAWEARGRRPNTVLDLDYRSTFWDSPDDATREAARALEHVTVAIGNQEECRVAVGESEPHRAADALLERGVELAIVKQGPKGVLAKTRDQVVEVLPHAVEVLNGLGAGDAFGGALCLALLSDWTLEEGLRFANAAGAIVARELECSTAMPTTSEVHELVSGAVHDPR